MGEKIKTHVNDNEYADTSIFIARSQNYSFHMCYIDSHCYLGKKNKAHEISFAVD